MNAKKPIAAVLCVFVLIPAAIAFASDLEWRVSLPHFGEVDFGQTHAQIISSPFRPKEGVCPKDAKDGQKECEEIFLRKWFRITPRIRSRIMISVIDVSRLSAYVPDYSLFISSRGGMLFAENKTIRFLYYTINADATKAVNIEKHRLRLDAMARQKKKIRLSGKITRIETSDTALFAEGKTETEFLDFYLSDIQFEQ